MLNFEWVTCSGYCSSGNTLRSVYTGYGSCPASAKFFDQISIFFDGVGRPSGTRL